MLCSNSLGLCDKPVRTAIYNELNKVLSDMEAFPRDSKQYQALAQFRKKLHSLFRVTGDSNEGQKGPDEGDIPKNTDQPVTKGSKKETNVTTMNQDSELSEKEEQEKPLPKSTLPTTKLKSMRGYVSTLKEHRALNAELDQVMSLKRQLDSAFQDLLKQSQIMKDYNQKMRDGGDVGEEYEKAMDKYEEDEKTHEMLKSQYREALNQYNQHQDAYRARMTN